MLGLRIHADAASLRERDHFRECRNLVETVVLLIAIGKRLDGAQRVDLGEREVAGEPVGDRHAVEHLGRLVSGELGMRGDVGGAAEHRLVTRDQHAVFRRPQFRLGVVGAEVDGEVVPRQSVVGAIAGRTAMDDDGRLGRNEGRRRGKAGQRSPQADVADTGCGAAQPLRGVAWAARR